MRAWQPGIRAEVTTVFLGVVLFGLDNVAASAKAGKGPHAKLDAVLDALPGCLQSAGTDAGRVVKNAKSIGVSLLETPKRQLETPKRQRFGARNAV